MTTMTEPENDRQTDDRAALDRIEALLDVAARAPRPVPGGDLMARIAADAEAEAARRRPRAATVSPAPVSAPVSAPARWLARLLGPLRDAVAQLGGAPVLASLAVAGFGGLMLGAFPPEAVLVLEEVVFGADMTLDFAALPVEFEE